MTIFASRLPRDFIRVQGKDALRFLQGMLTADVKRACLKDLYTCGRSFLLNNKGKIVAELLFFMNGEQEIYLSCASGYGQKVCETLDHFIIADDVTLQLGAVDFEVWCLPQGLQGGKALERVDASVPSAMDLVFRVSTLSEGVYFLPRAQLSQTHGEVWVRKGSSFTPTFQELSSTDILALRIERGVPEWGVDLTEESFLLEFPVMDAISFYKGCYIGQEVVARTTYRGHVVRAFSRFDFAADLNGPQYLVLKEQSDKVVGRATSVLGRRALGSVRLEPSTQPMMAQESGVDVVKVEILIDTKKE